MAGKIQGLKLGVDLVSLSHVIHFITKEDGHHLRNLRDLSTHLIESPPVKPGTFRSTFGQTYRK